MGRRYGYPRADTRRSSKLGTMKLGMPGDAVHPKNSVPKAQGAFSIQYRLCTDRRETAAVHDFLAGVMGQWVRSHLRIRIAKRGRNPCRKAIKTNWTNGFVWIFLEHYFKDGHVDRCHDPDMIAMMVGCVHGFRPEFLGAQARERNASTQM